MSVGHICIFGDASSVHVQRWISEMQQRNWRISVVTARPQPIEGVDQQVLRPIVRSTDWLMRVAEARHAVRLIKPDIVHAHYITSYGYLAARCNFQPLMMTAWGSDLLVTPHNNLLLYLLTKWTLKRAAILTGDSLDLLEAAQKICPDMSTELVHWGVDMSRFAPISWAMKPGFQAVSMRSWEENYNIHTILDAFSIVRKRFPMTSIQLHLLGGGSQETMLRAQAAKLGIASDVCFHGQLDDRGMAKVLNSCKLSISIPSSDATSVSVLESMACGLAVIASDLPANRYWITEDMLVPAGHAERLAMVWIKLIEQEDVGQSVSAQNILRIRDEGDRCNQMDTVDRLYRSLLHKSY